MRNFFFIMLLSLYSLGISAQDPIIETEGIELIDPSYAVGTIPGYIGVSPSGAATYTIPIDMPAGRAGMTPGIALVYDSQSVGNVLGKGWGISGFSAITRGNRTPYYNSGDNDNIDFIGDELLLDGQHLIQINENATEIEYRTEVDIYSKILYIKTGTYGPYFKVYTKSGTIVEYGNSDKSRQRYSSSGNSLVDDVPLAWHISQSYDRLGNTIVFEYYNDCSKGEIHPIQIYYTGFQDLKNNKSIFGSNVIEFTYAMEMAVKDKTTVYYEKNNQKYLSKNTWILTRVNITNNTKPIKEYTINYATGIIGVSENYFIKSISLKSYKVENANSSLEETTFDWLKETTFDWNFYKPDYNFRNEGHYFENYRQTYSKILALDLLGNNREEEAVYHVNTSGSSYPGEIILNGGTIIPVKVSNENGWDKMIAIDWDSNGDDELLLADDDGVKIYDLNKTNGDMDNVFSYTKGNISKIMAGDFTGDNVSDILIVSDNLAQVLIAARSIEGNITYTMSGYSLQIQNKDDIATISDFNGDGKMEILKRNFPNFLCITYSFNESNGFTPLATANIGSYSTGKALYFADFNGDGKTDICYLNTGVKLKHTWFSFGDGFIDPLSTNETINFDPHFVEDFNNDGRADFASLQFQGKIVTLFIYFTLPDGITTLRKDDTAEIDIEFDGIDQPRTSDVDGNGIRDIIIPLTNFIESGTHGYTAVRIVKIVDESIGKDLITTITDGHGVQTKIAYQRFGMNSELLTGFPLCKLRNKDFVVSETYVVGDVGQKWNRDTYSFKTPILHLTGKGFLGYKETQVNSYQNSLINTTLNEVLIKNNKYFYLYPATITTWSMTGGVQNKLLSETVNTFDIKVVNNTDSKYIPVCTKSVTKKWDNDLDHSYMGIIIQKQNVADMDNYGNSLTSEMIMDELASNSEPTAYSWKKNIINTYFEADETNWLIDRTKTSEIITYHAPEEPNIEPTFTQKTSYQYYGFGNSQWPLLEKKENLPNNDILLKTENWYDYDIYGNMISNTLKAMVDGTMAERTTEYVYSTDNENDGRFLTAQTIKAELSENDQTTKFTYNPVTCNLSSSTDLSGLVTNYEYDNLGKLRKTTMADGTSNEILINWSVGSIPSPPLNALYYVLSYKNCNSGTEAWNKSYTYYDKYSRPICNSVQGLNGEMVLTDTRYDNSGRIYQVSEPYKPKGKSIAYTTILYDELGRQLSQTLPTGVILSTEYKGRITKVTNNPSGIWKETTINISGNPIAIKDPTNGSIDYHYDAGSRIRSITSQGETTSFVYDAAGNKTKVIDPNAGTTTSTYNALGEFLTQTDTRGSTFTNTYDELGRIKTSSLAPGNELTTYNYTSKTENGFGQVKNVIKTIGGTNETRIEYIYDALERLKTKTDVIEGISYTFGYDYSTISGMLEYYTYPSNYKIKYSYNTYGYLNRVIENSTSNILWNATATNERGQLISYTLGNGLTTQKSFDAYGFPSSIQTKNITTNVNLQLLNYTFDQNTGNLMGKTEQISVGYNQAEYYEYDPVLKTRLTSWQVANGAPKYTIQYADNGNINTKSDVTAINGQYTYGENAGNTAVTGIDLPTTAYSASAKNQFVTYTGFNKVKEIRKNELTGSTSLYIYYGPDKQRIKSELVQTSSNKTSIILKTKYFFSDFEIEIDQFGTKRYLHYLSGGDGLFAIIEIKNSIKTPYYIHKDYLGNYNLITSGTGAKLETLSFDPWGRRRNPTNWSFTNVPATFLFDRGYTGHEHLDKFGIINMNGRVYDPFLGRFLSPDPIIQNPGNSQNYNRYSYCLNNPLKYTDPSGYKAKPVGWDGAWEYGVNLLRNFGSSVGSGHHWSDAYRSDYGNFMLMSKSTFINSFGSVKYNMYYNALEDGIGYTIDSKGTGYWKDSNSSETVGKTEKISVDGAEKMEYTISGIESGQTFVPFDDAVGGGGYDWGRAGTAIGAADVAYDVLENAVANKYGWMDAKGNYNSTKILSKGANGKFIQGVQGYRNGYNSALNAASKFRVAGNIVGGLGIGITLVQLGTNQITGLEATIDGTFGVISFMGPIGAGIGATYFIVKLGYEYYSGNTLFEKPQ